jgi:hypothetical protein
MLTRDQVALARRLIGEGTSIPDASKILNVRRATLSCSQAATGQLLPSVRSSKDFYTLRASQQVDHKARFSIAPAGHLDQAAGRLAGDEVDGHDRPPALRTVAAPTMSSSL